jgi:putative DNA primase/helicase
MTLGCAGVPVTDDTEYWTRLLDLPTIAPPARAGGAIEEYEIPRRVTSVPQKQPLAWARSFLTSEFHHCDFRTLVRWRGEWLVWRRGAWRTASEDEIRGDAYRWTDTLHVEDDKTGMPSPFRPNRAKISDLIDATRGLTAVADEQTMPSLLGPADIDPVNSLSLANGIVELTTRRLVPPTPYFFNSNSVDYSFNPKAPDPQTWLKFLDQIWGFDPDAQRALQEVFGYLLTADTSLQKAFMLIGPKRSGKGTIARVLMDLVGHDALASPTLSNLSTNFGLAPLIGKRVALVSDARLSARSDLAAIAERILAISGEDALTIDRKHLNAWTGRLFSRFLVLTNEMPRLQDAAGALMSRFIVLRMTENFYGREDPHLLQKLQPELPGIFLWAMNGLERLRARGRFTLPDSSKEVMGEFERSGSPVKAFLDDEVEQDPTASIACADLFGAWQTWCAASGCKPGTEPNFGNALRAVIPGLVTKRPQVGGHRFYEYKGLRLKR